MNPDTLTELNRVYSEAAAASEDLFTIHHVDTSFRNGKPPKFDRIAFVVAARILNFMHETLDQNLLVTDVVDVEGLEVRPERVEPVIRSILKGGRPHFQRRVDAEQSTSVMQVVPYALLTDAADRYLVARRRADHPRSELSGKFTLLLGGHAEQKDWDASMPDAIFERCLRRELDEELIGVSILHSERIGIIHDPRSKAGQHHLAVLFEVQVGGRPKIRRQSVDQEFGREPLTWKTAEEIKALVAELDPWSQLVARHRFGAQLPELPGEPTLFTRGRDAGN